MSLRTVNPATGEILESYRTLAMPAIHPRIESAYETFQVWQRTPLKNRASLLRHLANRLRSNQDELALLMAKEMGKPLAAGKQEIEKCAWVCEHYAAYAARYLRPQSISVELQKCRVYYQPLGVIFGIMPWNFPFWQVFRFAIPTLMAGNVVLIKHAPSTLGCGEAIEKLFLQAGALPHLLQHVIMDVPTAAEVIAHERIMGVSLTGSERAGKSVASQAGRYLKKVVLELGGNDPYVVLQDADLKKAADIIVASRLNNTGQVCIAVKRVIVEQSIHDALLHEITVRAKAAVMGDPLDKNTTLGPMAREDLRNNVHQQVLVSLAKGAKLILGGEIPDKKGYYYPPTILTEVKAGMPAFDDEVFGPVIAMIKAKDEKHAIELANHSRFGLGGAVFTQNIKRGTHLAREAIETGVCFVNAMVKSDPRLPFGGVKHSGFGRELGKEGILSFVNVKLIAINL